MKKLKLFDTPWHIGHQYEMLKFGFAEWYWMYQHRREYSANARGDLRKLSENPIFIADSEWNLEYIKKMRGLPIDKGFKWVPHYEAGKYDVAILHLDQGCLEDQIMKRGKGSVFMQLNEVIKDIPKIVIMHGTPFHPEYFATAKEIVDRANELIGDNYFICNSHAALKQWGRENHPKSRVIIHGMDPIEWWDLPKEPRVVTMISPAGFAQYYDRTFLEYVKEGLAERDIAHCHITQDYQADDFDSYRNFMGRSMIYFNPTKESPMPRSRTEAMLSGACVLTTPHQDADMFIKDGENGFIVPRNVEYVVSLIESLINDPERAMRIGQAGKKTAIELFNKDRYAAEWESFLEFVINDFKSKENK